MDTDGRFKDSSACFTLKQKKKGWITSHSQETDVEVMGKKFPLLLALDLPAVLRLQCVHVGLPRDDVIWSVFGYDNSGEGKLFTFYNMQLFQVGLEIS